MGFSCQSPMLNKLFSSGGCRRKIGVRGYCIGLGVWQAQTEISPKIGSWLGKTQQKFECTCTLFSMVAQTASARAPPCRKTLPATVAIRNGYRNHPHLRLYLLNKDPLSKFSNFWPKFNNETKSSRIPKNSDLKYSSMSKIWSSSWWGFVTTWCKAQHNNKNAMRWWKMDLPPKLRLAPTSVDRRRWRRKITCTNR